MNSANENQQPRTHGDANQREDQPGGATNFSLDQLKKEGDISNPGEDNPDNIENPDDLHEVRVGDDLGEPDADQQKSGSGNGQANDQNEEISSGASQDEVIPPSKA